MGVNPLAGHPPIGGQPVAPGAEQDALLGAVTSELADKGFIVANLDKLVTWARTGSDPGFAQERRSGPVWQFWQWVLPVGDMGFWGANRRMTLSG